LLDKLSLHMSELFEVSLKEGHLFLLGAVIGRTEDVVVFFAGFIEGNFEFDNLRLLINGLYKTRMWYNIPSRICFGDPASGSFS
jgi:hypothetical protein